MEYGVQGRREGEGWEGADRETDREWEDVDSGWIEGGVAGRRKRRDIHRRRRIGEGICGEGGADGGEVYPGWMEREGRREGLSEWRRGEIRGGWEDRIPRESG